jgi:hypothetical protein
MFKTTRTAYNIITSIRPNTVRCLYFSFLKKTAANIAMSMNKKNLNTENSITFGGGG